MMDIIFTPEFQNRFWKKVDRRTPDVCWEWLGCLQSRKKGEGYGRISAGSKPDRKVLLAHRVAYCLQNGALPNDLVIDHICSNKKCVNPYHLEAVSIGENNIRALIRLDKYKGMQSPKKRLTRTIRQRGFCSKGHEMTTENTRIYYYKNAKRRLCRICNRESKRLARRRKKQNT